MSPFWILLALRMTEVVLTTATTRRAKLQSNCHHQQNNIQFFTGRMPFLSPDQQCQSTEGKNKLHSVAIRKNGNEFQSFNEVILITVNRNA